MRIVDPNNCRKFYTLYIIARVFLLLKKIHHREVGSVSIVQSRYDFQRETNDVTPLIDATRGSSSSSIWKLSVHRQHIINSRLLYPFDCYCLMVGLIA
jgi:hypothetical protein